MKHAGHGDTVKVHYTGRLDDSTVFDSSADRDSLEFTIGSGQVIKGFEEAVVGMSQGETKVVTVAPEEGYGPHVEELVLRVGKSDFPSGIEPEEGLVLDLRNSEGDLVEVVVSEVTDDAVVLDANHPLAGETLTFEIELMEIL
jgi:peptidylprolyl isomerase